MREVWVCFSTHRIEILPFAQNYMQNADLIILEEPYNPYLDKFLKEEIDEDTYLKTEEFWFPQFVRETLKILRELYKRGKKILQIEPYLEKIKLIQEKLEKEEKINLNSDEVLREVYKAENKAVGKLLEFYEASIKKDFETVVEKVKEFSKADAERFRLRDYLRAKKIIENLPQKGKVYIEAGTIHQYLKKLLILVLRKNTKVLHKFLLEEVFKPLFNKPFIFPPGEALTLRYIFSLKKNDLLENILAARSLIYIRIIPKDELIPTEKNPFPHLKKELKAILMVNLLNFEDCKNLYKRLMFIKDSEEGEKEVESYVKKYLGTPIHIPDDVFFIRIWNNLKNGQSF